jgi:hypothetical protein
MFNTYHLKKVAMNVKVLVIKVVKCKQSIILTSIQNHYNKLTLPIDRP